MATLREHSGWGPTTAVLVGAWLLTSPGTFGYGESAMAISDRVVGATAVIFGLLAISPRRAWAAWVVFAAGFWALFAPLLLWAAEPAAYLNSTAAGIVLIAMSVVVTRLVDRQAADQPAIPPGWSFNPSSFVQRAPIIALAWLSFLMARHMAGYQLGHSDSAWDPVFGEGTENILTSEVSKAFPVSDAGLGAAAYALEALIGYMGGAARWRTAPWVVALFGVLVVPVGIVSIVLIVLQPVAVGDWCTLCLASAAAMLAMVVLTLPEVVAMLLFLMQRRRQGHGLWQSFWRGGPMDDAAAEPRAARLSDPPSHVWRAMTQGVTLPWTLAASLALGVWLMLSPPMYRIEAVAGDAHFVIGALAITVAAIALAEVAQVVRWVNVALGLAMIAAVWLLPGADVAARLSATVAGALLAMVSLPRGRIRETYGQWERWIR
ncbi:MAG: vitamin K epoxide reductase family protein [Phycisphaeraceae bacterium]